MDTIDKNTAQKILLLAQQETARIEKKFSRYRNDNIIYQINHSSGKKIQVDEEMASLLDYASHCYAISDGMFDITSGVLRKVWKFDGSDNLPSKHAVQTLLGKIGWKHISWQRPFITLPENMQIDLGGIGKEYAVDKTAILLEQHNTSVLVNFGGDLRVTRHRKQGRPWVVGIEDTDNLADIIDNKSSKKSISASVNEYDLSRGGIATSGDTRRYLIKDGVRYSHILDPRTGWPVKDAPHSITVAAGTCIDAGIIATLAMLHGAEAEAFLSSQGVIHWCQR